MTATDYTPERPPRESAWIRVVLTVAWVLGIVAVAQDYRAAANGRLLVLTALMTCLLVLLAVVQGILVKGWPRRIGSWSLVIAYAGVGLVALSAVFLVPPRWFAVGVTWVILIAAWGIGVLWWRAGWRWTIAAWCLLPMALLAGLLARRAPWPGRVEVLEVGNMAIAGGFGWIGEEPDLFFATGLEMRQFQGPQSVVTLAGATTARHVIPDGVRTTPVVQHDPASAVMVAAEILPTTLTTKVQLDILGRDGAMESVGPLDAHGVVTDEDFSSFDTGGPWRVFPRLVAPGDDPAKRVYRGVTFRHRDTGVDVHVDDLKAEFVFPADHPDRFMAVTSEGDFEDDAEGKLQRFEVLILLAVDLTTSPATVEELQRIATPHWSVEILGASPADGVFLAPLPPAGSRATNNYPSVEHVDWETGTVTSLGKRIARENVRIFQHRETLCAFLLEANGAGMRLVAHDGRKERGAISIHPLDRLRAVSISPDRGRAGVVLGRGFMPGVFGQVYSTQSVFVWELETGETTEIGSQSIMTGIFGAIPAMSGGDVRLLQWSRDGKRLAQFWTGMRPFNTFQQWRACITIYHVGEWMEAEQK